MIRLICRKELTEVFRTATMSWLLAGMVVLVGLALYNGYTYAIDHQQLLSESQQVTYQQFINQGNKNPHLGAHFGFYAYKPMSDLALLENGIDDYTGNSFYLEPHQRGIVRFKEITDSTALRSFGFLNIGYFVQFILPLFIFLLSHNLFAKEWENGTIKMVLSSRVTARRLFAGKLLAGWLLVSALLALVILIPLGLLLGQPQPVNLGTILPTYACYAIGLVVYAALLTVLGVSVSLLTRSSALALVLLTGFWLLGVFLVPRLVAELSRRVYPSITSVEFDRKTFREKEYGIGNEGTKDFRREQLKNRTLKQYGVSRLEDLPVFFIPITIEYFEESDGKIMDQAYQAIETNENRQDRLILASAILSPFLAFRDLSMHLTATDMNTHYDFAAKAELHRRKVGEQVDAYYQKNTTASNAFWKTVPQFAYCPPGLSWRLTNALGAIGILLLWSMAVAGLMVVAYRRMRISVQ